MNQMSEVITFFEKSFFLFNQEYFKGTLPETIITVQSTPKSYGHASVRKIWVDETRQYYELNMSADHLDRFVGNVLATLLHEMVHIYCRENHISEVSREGTYHNKYFKKECECRDLAVEKTGQYGWAKTDPTESFMRFVTENGLLSEIPLVRKTTTSLFTKEKKKQSSRKYSCPVCTKTVRATSVVNIICGDCGETYMCEIES